jgi:hypothetical protein
MDRESKIWYVLTDNQKLGPFSAEELLGENPPISEKFTKDFLVWKTGMISWLRAADVPEFGAHFNPQIQEDDSTEVEEPVLRESVSPDGAEDAFEHSKPERIVEKIKNSIRDFRQSNPIAVTAIAAGAALIFICFSTAFVYDFVENWREKKKLAAGIEQRAREFRERQELREQAFRDSVEAVELEKRRKTELENQKKTARDNMAKKNLPASSDSPSYNYFTDPRDGNKYKIRKFGGAVWFLEDLDNGKEFNWWQAAVACPKEWRLPSDKEWKALSSILKSGAGNYFGSKYYWWSAVEGADSWYVSGGSLVCYSGNDNKSAVYRVRCVKE